MRAAGATEKDEVCAYGAEPSVRLAKSTWTTNCPVSFAFCFHYDSPVSNDILIGNCSYHLLRCLFIVAIRCPVISFLSFKFYFCGQDRVLISFDILEINTFLMCLLICLYDTFL